MNLRFTLSNDTLGTDILEYSPKGWEDLSIKLTRDPEFHGMIVEYPTNLQFHCKAGRQYLLDAYQQLGIDAEVTLTIDKCCGNRPRGEGGEDYSDDYSEDYGSSVYSLSGCTWEPFIVGIIQMKDIKVDPDYVTAPLIQSTAYQKFRNRLDNVVDLSSEESLDGETLTVIDPIDFTLHNKGIVLVSKGLILEGSDFVEYGPDGFTEPTNVHTPPFIFGDENFIQEAYSIGINVGQDNLDMPNIFENITPYSRNVTISFRIKFEMSGGACGSNTGQFNTTKLLISKHITAPEVALNAIELVSRDICNGQSRFVDFTYTADLAFAPDEKLKLWVSTSVFDLSAGAVPPTFYYDFDLSYFNFKGELPFPATITKAYALHEAGAAISQRILDKDEAFYSETLGRKNSLPDSYAENGCESFGVLFSGLMARAFPYADNPLRMSLRSYYNGLSPIYNLGMGIDKVGAEFRVLIEDKKKFYKDTVLFRLQDVPDIQTSLLQDYFFSEVRFGFENWETEEVSGIDEFNTKRYYNTAIKAVSNILEKMSTFIASGYSIELTRRKQWKDDNTNEDYKNDNEIFIACTARGTDVDGVPDEMDIAEKAENFDLITGIYSPETSYNLRISPERNKLRHNGIIAPSLLKYPGRVLKFTYGEGNYKACYRGFNDCDIFTGALLCGDQNVAWDSPNLFLNPPIWNPIVDEFSVPLTQEQVEEMVMDNRSLIQYGKDDEEIIEGWILEADVKVQSGLTKFKMLRKYDGN